FVPFLAADGLDDAFANLRVAHLGAEHVHEKERTAAHAQFTGGAHAAAPVAVGVPGRLVGCVPEGRRAGHHAGRAPPEDLAHWVSLFRSDEGTETAAPESGRGDRASFGPQLAAGL